MRILIADDSSSDQNILLSMLKRFGECSLASSGQEAITMFSQALEAKTPFDLICLDIKLPDIAGHEVLTRIRAKEKIDVVAKIAPAKIVMISGLSDVKSILNATTLGCDGYVTKPIDKERLMGELNKLGITVELD